MIDRFAAGRTDLVFDLLVQGLSATATDADGVSLLSWCAYYGDVSAIRFLLAQGAVLEELGEDLGLAVAAFHGHWKLCQLLIEKGADVNWSESETGETALHSALCTDDRLRYDRVVKVLLAAGADPNAATKPGVETGAFMRDCRTRGETPLHRAAAVGTVETVRLLLKAGARVDAKDVNGDSPLSWASWHRRPVSVLRLLCYGDFYIRPDYGSGMASNLLGDPEMK
jgi:ankyrin repeat protein